ncbi:BAG family molecular chaperone regulator 1 [Aphelenchoides besseyi]|nr:BAG family molecular chaperone regulator 1 [Aphelenchoides besseyi]KAI6230931.1 BAG family molecular chaperone regulator 1 [Aphelenchoides besseyi]
MNLLGCFPHQKKMIAEITIDCLGKKFPARVLVDEATADETSSTETKQSDADNQQRSEEEAPLLRTVGDLRRFIADELQIESESLKIIHRGKFIGNNMDERLADLRFRNKDVIKVMGKPMKTDPGFASLCAYERANLMKLNQKFEENGKDVEMLEKNFLDGKNREEMIKKTEKILKLFNETAEKHLEALDGLKIFDEETSEEQKVRNREKRKQIVNGVLGLLNLNDKYLRRLDDYKFKSEHPDEGR